MSASPKAAPHVKRRVSLSWFGWNDIAAGDLFAIGGVAYRVVRAWRTTVGIDAELRKAKS